jgi:hypothetical protein
LNAKDFMQRQCKPAPMYECHIHRQIPRWLTKRTNVRRRALEDKVGTCTVVNAAAAAARVLRSGAASPKAGPRWLCT